MPYATQQDMVDHFGATRIAQLTDRVNGTTIDTAVLNKALAWADNLINSKVATRLTVPVTPVPGRLIDIACDLGLYALYDVGVPDDVRLRYQDAVRQLDAVRDGKETLGIDALGAEPAAPAEGTVQFGTSYNVFDRKDTSFI